MRKEHDLRLLVRRLASLDEVDEVLSVVDPPDLTLIVLSLKLFQLSDTGPHHANMTCYDLVPGLNPCQYTEPGQVPASICFWIRLEHCASKDLVSYGTLKDKICAYRQPAFPTRLFSWVSRVSAASRRRSTRSEGATLCVLSAKIRDS